MLIYFWTSASEMAQPEAHAVAAAHNSSARTPEQVSSIPGLLSTLEQDQLSACGAP